ncbi:MAG: alcohol dehydrogenase [Microbacterium sp.]|nr:alcohol dehydrogenase [Microbacterium sp.]
MKAWQRAAATTEGPSELALNDIAEPSAAAGEVLLDVKAAGVCHTDIGYLNGSISSLLATSPITLGHEVAGVVAALGDGVTDFAVGDRVAVLCYPTSPGTGRDGGFQPRLAVQTDLLVRVPDEVAWDQAAASTDAGATSYHAVVTTGRALAGEKVGIIGLGGVGVLGAQAALSVGATVYAADPNEGLHAFAREIGATKVVKDISELAGEDLDLVVDFAGFGTTTAGAIEVVGEHGRVVQVGLGRIESTINTWSVVAKQVEYLGSLGGTLDDNAKVLELMAAGKMTSFTQIVGFDDIPAAIESVRAGQATKGRFVVSYD